MRARVLGFDSPLARCMPPIAISQINSFRFFAELRLLDLVFVQLVHGNAFCLPTFDKVVALPLVPDVTVINTLQGNELPNALLCANLFCDANLLLETPRGGSLG